MRLKRAHVWHVTTESNNVSDSYRFYNHQLLSQLPLLVAATQVRCAAALSSVSLMMCLTILWVVVLVDPPAPYVTDTNLGFIGASCSIDCQSLASNFGVFGGKIRMRCFLSWCLEIILYLCQLETIFELYLF